MSRWHLLRISTVNLLVLVLVVLLVWGRRPLIELQHQLHIGMTFEQVTSNLGQPVDLRRTESTLTHLSPSVPEAPVILNFRREADAARCVFTMPERLTLTFNERKPDTFFWLDNRHALVLHFARDGSLQEILLVPNKLEPATFQEWCKHQFNRFKRAVGL